MAFENEDRPSDSPYVERVYRSEGTTEPTRMRSVAYPNWELVVWRDRGRTHVAVRGPETGPTTVEVGGEASLCGIIFAHGAAMPHLPVPRLVDAAVMAPHVTSDTLVLRGEEWATTPLG